MRRMWLNGSLPVLTEQFLTNLEQPIRVKWLHHPTSGAGLASALLHGVGGFRREHDDRRAFVVWHLP